MPDLQTIINPCHYPMEIRGQISAEIYIFIKECEWRLNYRPVIRLYKIILAWAKLGKV
jgi:hypothetical protein